MKKIVSLGATALVAVAVGFVAGELNSNAHYTAWNADGNVAVRGHHIENCGGLGNCWDWCQQQCPWINGTSGVDQTASVSPEPAAEPVSDVVQTAAGAEEASQASAAETTPEDQQAAPEEAPAAPSYDSSPQENYGTSQCPAGYNCNPDYSDCTPQYPDNYGNGSGHHSGGHHGHGGHH